MTEVERMEEEEEEGVLLVKVVLGSLKLFLGLHPTSFMIAVTTSHREDSRINVLIDESTQRGV